MLAIQNAPAGLPLYAGGGQTVTGSTGADTLFAGQGNNTLAGNGGADIYQIGSSGSTTIVNAGNTAASGSVQFELGVKSNNLWLVHSGNNLVADVLGSNEQVTIQNWYSGAGNQVQGFTGSDGLKLDTAVNSLVQAMASFSSSHSGFNPATALDHSVVDSATYGAVSSAYSSAWHA